MSILRKVVVSSVLAGCAATAWAHHGWTGYEEDIRKLDGVIEQSSYTNPHATIKLKAEDKTWTVVLAPTTRMTTRGLTAEMIKAGTTVTVEGYQSTSDKNEMRAERIVVNDKTIELR